jgi:GNAT superfamily N-acetyltransferase
MPKATIRKASPEDIPAVFALIEELAIYEKAPHELINTPQQLLTDGFGDQPLYQLLVAEVDSVVVGISLSYFRYSTWKGKCLYLEDIVITQSYRRYGIGSQLFEATIELGKSLGCRRLNWQVLEWNEPAINFYKKHGAGLDPEWVNGWLQLA